MNKQIVADSIEFYGDENQLIVSMEECAELIQAISKTLRYGLMKQRGNVVEEMADVTICLEIIKQVYGIEDSEIEFWIDKKQKREVERMENRE